MKNPYNRDEVDQRHQKKVCLKQHAEHSHSEDKPFKCELCEFRSNHKGVVKNHLKTHFPETVVKPFSCSECPYKCTSNANLKVHLMIHTGEKPFGCELCPYRATKPSQVTKHAVTHTKEKPHKCSQCPFSCSFLENLRRHVRHLHTNKGARPFSCSFPGCEKKYPVNAALKMHVLSVHAKKTRFKCPSCPKEFYFKYDCMTHIRCQHTKEKPFKCSTCDYSAATANQVTRHVTSKHGGFLGLKCPLCHKACPNKKSLEAHRSYVHSARPRGKARIKCDADNCEKQFASRSGLRIHIKGFHLKLKPFNCPLCDYSFARAIVLNEHIKTHTGEKPYKCDLCHRSFAGSGGLTRHKAIAHSESRPFKCDLCEVSTKTKQHLKQHQEVHNPVPVLYECSICKESGGTLLAKNKKGGPKLGAKFGFTQKSTLVEHMIRHSDERPFKCHLCDYAAKLPRDLKKHFLKIHQGKRQQSPSVCKRRANGFESGKLNKIAAVTRKEAKGSSGLGPNEDNVKKCRPCSVLLVRLNPSTLTIPNIPPQSQQN